MTPVQANLSLSDKLRLVLEWLPAIQLLPAIAAAEPGKDQILQVVRLLEVIADKTEVTTDDELVGLVKDVLQTEQGGRLIDYIVVQIRRLTNA